VTEVFTPAGNWSSYPSHRHDEDDFPRMTYLEETYYHRLNPPQGFGVQRVYTEDGSLDEVMAVKTPTWCWCRAATTPAARPMAMRCIT
jgi:5-deoxy-glucuronate isomerase